MIETPLITHWPMMLSMNHRSWIVFAFTALALLLAGCGGPEVGQVHGTVTFRGQPVKEGIVTFSNAATGYAAEATLGSDGSYKMETTEGGMVVGDYQVAITPPIVIDNSDPRTPPSEVEKKVADIPQPYRLLETSPLKATVKPGENKLDFDMQP